MKTLNLVSILILSSGLAWAQDDGKTQPAPKPTPALDELKGQDGAGAPAQAPEAQGAPVVGVGIRYVRKAEGQPQFVWDIVENSPAEKAGLKPGDWIIEIDSAPVAAMTADDIPSKLRGPKGSQVTLKIKREDQATKQASTFVVTITRDVFVVVEKPRPLYSDSAMVKELKANQALKNLVADLDLSTLTVKNQDALRTRAEINFKATYEVVSFLADYQELMEAYRKDNDVQAAARELSRVMNKPMRRGMELMKESAEVEVDEKDLSGAEQRDPNSDVALAQLAISVGKRNVIRALNEAGKFAHAQMAKLVAKGATGYDSWTKWDYAKNNADNRSEWADFDKKIEAMKQKNANLPPRFEEKLKVIDQARAYGLPDSEDGK